MGIVAARRHDVAQVRHEILVTCLAVVLRVGDVQFRWTPRHQISNIVQLAIVNMFSSGWFPAQRAGAVGLVAGFFDDFWLGQVFNPHICGIGLILAWTVFGDWLGACGCSFHPASLLQKCFFRYIFIGSRATVSIFAPNHL